MWTTNSSAKRRPANRRHARHAKRQAEWQQLDVKMRPRRRKRPLRRNHRGVWGLRIAAIAVSVTSLTAGARWIYQESVVDNTEFKLQQLLVYSDGALSPRTLAEVSGVETGVNLMTLDLDAIRESIEAMPLVDSATVERVFPADLEIRVSEKKPIAWLACQAEGVFPRMTGGSALLSAEGEVLRCDQLLPQFQDLPIIEVPAMPGEGTGKQAISRQLETAIELLEKSANQFAASGLELLEIKLHQPYSLACVYNQDLKVTFGLSDLERQLQDLEWIITSAVSNGRKLSTVNTMMERNIPVTFQDFVPPKAGSSEFPNLRPLGNQPTLSGDSKNPPVSSDLRTILRRG